MAGAQVVIEALGLSATTDQAGEFELTAPAGLRVLTVRAIGYEAAIITVNLSETEATSVTIELRQLPQILDSLTTTVDAPAIVSAKMMGFEDRRRIGAGDFLTRDQLAKRENALLSDVLRTTGLPFIRRPAACGGGFSAASNRGNGSMRPDIPRCGPAIMPVACYMAVYLDGMRLWAPPQTDLLNIDSFSPRELEAVEIYRGTGQAPTQYTTTGNSCGVILLWTRER